MRMGAQICAGSGPVEQRPQPYYDFEIAKICTWLKANGYTIHITLAGSVTLRKKP